jgi:multidrug efflux pump subunit AcrA (membrane-fusion protein)
MTDERQHGATPVSSHSPCRRYTGAIVTISMLIACLFAANLYTLDRLNSAREQERELGSSFGRQIGEIKTQNRELLLKYALLKETHARQIAQVREELDHAAKQLGASTSQVLARARTMVEALQELQTRQADDLQEQIGQKANTQDLLGLMGSVSSAESDLGATQRTLHVLEQDLSAARSKLGELASNSDEQRQALQEFTDGEYHDFTLEKNQPIRIKQIGLKLRKTNARDQIFSLDLVANDHEIRNRDRSVFEPIIFYLDGVRSPCEVVITAVGPDNVTGYVRVPKSRVARNRLHLEPDQQSAGVAVRAWTRPHS